jgi:16S rRNA (cytosine1402-N4)-methyltransferase
VLSGAVVEHAAVQPGDTIVDGTFGAGGHARLLAPSLGSNGRYIAVDRDESTRPLFDSFVAEEGAGDANVEYELGDFPTVFARLTRAGVSANVVILDVGVSSMQLDRPERGFSYANDAPLDMRMDQSAGPTAADLVNGADEQQIESWLREFGEERHARRIARRIVERRIDRPFERTADFADVVRAAIPAADRHKRRGDPSKRAFQALRIAVNDELGMLDRGLDAAFELLSPGGRLVVISFHSLEDRMVKQRFVQWSGKCTCPPGLPICACGAEKKVDIITSRAVVADDSEQLVNTRSTSAKLRVARKVAA